MKTFSTFAEAEAVKREGQSVAGAFGPDDKPVYFLVSADTPAESMRRLAFQVRNNRPLSGYENTMLELAEAGVK
jgi:hypothetical protein